VLEEAAAAAAECVFCFFFGGVPFSSPVVGFLCFLVLGIMGIGAGIGSDTGGATGDVTAEGVDVPTGDTGDDKLSAGACHVDGKG
jgi:hypothetical protein